MPIRKTRRHQARKQQSRTPVEPKPRYNIVEAAQLLGISRTRLYERIRDRRIATVQDGRATFITHAELLRYAEQPQPKRATPTQPQPAA